MKKLINILNQPDKLLHIIAGLVIAAFFYIILGMDLVIVPVIFAAFIKEFVDQWRSGCDFDWYDFSATIIGGAVIQIMVICV